jgi:hypothetical protein
VDAATAVVAGIIACNSVVAGIVELDADHVVANNIV